MRHLLNVLDLHRVLVCFLMFFTLLVMGRTYDQLVLLNSLDIKIDEVKQAAREEAQQSKLVYEGEEFFGELQIEIPKQGFQGNYHLILDIHADSQLQLYSQVLYFQNLDSSSRYCAQSAGSLNCKIPLNYESNSHTRLVLINNGADVVVNNIAAENVGKHMSIGGADEHLLVLLLVFVFVALLIGSVKSGELKLKVLLVSSLGYIALLSVSLAAFILVYVLLAYKLASAQLNKKVSVGFSVFIHLLAIVGIKYFLPITHAYFSVATLLLPIGFSYLVARQIDTVLKIGKGEITQEFFKQHILFSLFWPSFAAGPITEVNKVIFGNPRTDSDLLDGGERVARGFFKKAIADLLFVKYFVAANDAVQLSGFAPEYLWPVLFFNMLYVYLDFSAYSDIAIGCASLMGVRIPENFNNPLFKSGMREFWRSWHISLSQWVSRNVFIPLTIYLRYEHRLVRYFVPSFATMTVIGLWHAFSLTWILWALHHYMGILLTDLFSKFRKKLVLKTKSSVANKAGQCLSFTVGMMFVWIWFMLSFCFTLTNNVDLALNMYLDAIAYPHTLFVTFLQNNSLISL